jgi:hypothetical protein
MPKRPRDPNQLAKLIVDIATGEVEDAVSESKRNPSSKLLDGSKGGRIRAINLSTGKRKAIAKKAARARWAKK